MHRQKLRLGTGATGNKNPTILLFQPPRTMQLDFISRAFDKPAANRAGNATVLREITSDIGSISKRARKLRGRADLLAEQNMRS